MMIIGLKGWHLIQNEKKNCCKHLFQRKTLKIKNVQIAKCSMEVLESVPLF